MGSHRLLTVNPDNDPMGVHLNACQAEERWAAALLADNAPPPEPDSLRGLAFFRQSPEDAERLALECLGEGVMQN